jgi:hypothetical protein
MLQCVPAQCKVVRLISKFQVPRSQTEWLPPAALARRCVLIVNMATNAGSAAVDTTREAYERDGYVVADGVLPLATMCEWKDLVQRECVVSAAHSHGTQA